MTNTTRMKLTMMRLIHFNDNEATHSKFRRIERELIQKGICKTLKLMFAISIKFLYFHQMIAL